MTLEKHSTPASNAGFNYQFERAMLWLVQASSGTRVGIETLDDVAIETSNGEVYLEQDKLSFQENANVFSDRSKNLWNTITTWLKAIKNGEVNLSQARFFLASNKKCESPLIHNISNATTSNDALACIHTLKNISTTPSKAIEPFVNEIFKEEYKSILPNLILKIELADISTSDRSSLRTQIIDFLPIPEWAIEYREGIVHALHGWLLQQVMGAWEAHIQAWILRDAFVNQFHAILASLRRQKCRERMEHLIPLHSGQINKQKGATFVKQVYLVSDDDELVEESITDYLRSSIEKIRLSKEGDITDEDWIGFESNLKRHWKTISRRVLATQSDLSDREQGFCILDQTTDHKEYLAGEPTEQPYLTRGALHRLANIQKIGWHPKYKDLLK